MVSRHLMKRDKQSPTRHILQRSATSIVPDPTPRCKSLVNKKRGLRCEDEEENPMHEEKPIKHATVPGTPIVKIASDEGL